jgi:ABC-type transport system involved in multi-copper enzyme maturation permease subunit
MFGLIFGRIGANEGFDLPRVKVVVANQDLNGPRLQAGSKNIPGGIKADTLSELMVAVLESEDMADLLELSRTPDGAAARAAVDNRQAQVAIIIPEGFSRQFADQYGKAEVEFYQDPTLTIGPSIVKSILSQFMDGLSGIKISLDTVIDVVTSSSEANPILVGNFIQRYLDTSITQTSDLREKVLEMRLPATPQADEKKENKGLVGILGPIMGGMAIFYAFYTATASAESILREEEERTLPRLFTTPTPQSTILSGKFLAVFLTVIVQFIVMLIAGRLIFQIQWGNLAGMALLVLGVVAVASSFGIFVNSFLKDTKQGGIVFGGVLTLTGMIGMMRIFTMGMASPPPMLSTITLLVPQGWGIHGLLLAMDNAMMTEVAAAVLVMIAWAALFFIVGVWRFNKRYA